MTSETLLIDQREGIARVTINRPEKLNALNGPVLEELKGCFESIAQDENVKIVILTGAGEKSFVAGADVKELASQAPGEGAQFAARGQRLFDFIENLGKPVIAAINGFALGGGCELAMACTLRIASETARFGQPEVKLGIIPGYGGTQRLPRLIGEGKALEMILTGDTITAEEALRVGLVNRVVPQKDLLKTAEELARKIIANAPLAVQAGLRAVRQSRDRSHNDGMLAEAALFGKCAATADLQEGVHALLEKRSPKFEGK